MSDPESSRGPPTTIGVETAFGTGVETGRGLGVAAGLIGGIVFVTTTRPRDLVDSAVVFWAFAAADRDRRARAINATDFIILNPGEFFQVNSGNETPDRGLAF